MTDSVNGGTHVLREALTYSPLVTKIMGTDRAPKSWRDLVGYAEELEEIMQRWVGHGNAWRWIANEMGYEPNAHKHPPLGKWISDRVAKFRAQVVAEALAATPATPAPSIGVERALRRLEWCNDDYALRVPYDGDAGDDGREIITGGDIVVTFADSDEGDKLRLAIIKLMESTA